MKELLWTSYWLFRFRDTSANVKSSWKGIDRACRQIKLYPVNRWDGPVYTSAGYSLWDALEVSDCSHIKTVIGERRIWSKTVACRVEGGFTPLPPEIPKASKIVPNPTRLWKLSKNAEFRTPTPQDVRKKAVKFWNYCRIAIVLH